MNLERYVAMTKVNAEVASITLTRGGLAYGSDRSGAHELARYVQSIEGWHGARSEADLASEIRAHCLAWFWLPPLRRHANPIDLEFNGAWPANLLLALRRLVSQG